jgi:mannose-1-phosphate guanylyltransferase / mannose-6-phosphate isomerase
VPRPPTTPDQANPVRCNRKNDPDRSQFPDIRSGAPRRLENPGKIPLRVIEVQSGSYLGEDEIVHFEDHYGRE